MVFRAGTAGGFTLVEILVALAVFTAGGLSIAALVSSLALAGTKAERLGLAATLAGARAQKLRIGGCSGSDGSEEPVPGIRITWSAATGSPGHAVVVVEHAVRGHSRSDSLEFATWCQR